MKHLLTTMRNEVVSVLRMTMDLYLVVIMSQVVVVGEFSLNTIRNVAFSTNFL